MCGLKEDLKEIRAGRTINFVRCWEFVNRQLNTRCASKKPGSENGETPAPQKDEVSLWTAGVRHQRLYRSMGYQT
jgi:hypothetical protein